MSEKTTYDIHDDDISFFKQSWKQVAFIDNDPDLYAIVKSISWHDNNGYLYSSKLKDYLHRIVVAHKIGREQLKMLTEQGFVVDHINNDEPYNCRLDNLHLLHSDINKAKGLTVDKDIERVRLRAGIGLYCLKNGCFQIAIGFNDPNICFCVDGKLKHLDTLHLTFESFEKCYVALQAILLWLKCEHLDEQLAVNHLGAVNIQFTESTYLELTDEEKDGRAIIQRGDKLYFRVNNVPGKGFAIIHKPHKIE